MANIFSDIASEGVSIDIISQTSPHDGVISLSFSMPHSDLSRCVDLVKKYVRDESEIIENAKLSKLTVEGIGMQRQPGVASKLFGALAEKDISIYIITTSETEICFCVDAIKAKDAVCAVSEAFCL